ncbi:hypothetical protein B0H14DRAFT_3076924, partial [Mycena olivaceomarginata]
MLPLVVASEIVDQRLPLDSIVGSQWVGRRLVIIEILFSDPSDRTIKGSMYKHPAIQAMTKATVFKNLLANAVQYPELFDDSAPQPLDDDPRTKPATTQAAIFGCRNHCIHQCGTCIARAIVCSLYWPRPDPYPPAVLPCAQIPRVNHRKSTV